MSAPTTTLHVLPDGSGLVTPIRTWSRRRSGPARLVPMLSSTHCLEPHAAVGLPDERCFWPATPTGSAGKAVELTDTLPGVSPREMSSGKTIAGCDWAEQRASGDCQPGKQPGKREAPQTAGPAVVY